VRGLKAADEEALEARLLDEQRGKRVMGTGKHQRFFGLGKLPYGR
jgi:hypothetical protein